MTGRCPECGHDPSSDELERRCEQLEEENKRLRALLKTAGDDLVDKHDSWRCEHPDRFGVCTGAAACPSQRTLAAIRAEFEAKP